MKMLINKGANLNIKDFDGNSAIFHALDVNNEKAISLLINAGVNPNQIDSSKRTPLHIATLSKKYDIALLLLNNGANPNKIDFFRRTPLHLAIIDKQYDIALLLLNKGANPNPTDIYGKTPMHWLVALSVVGGFNSKQEHELNPLIKKGANPHKKDTTDDMTPIEMLYNKKNNSISTKFKNKFKKSILNRKNFSVGRFLHNRTKMTGNKNFLKTLSPEYIDKRLKKINRNMEIEISANSIKDLKNKQNYLMKLKKDMEKERKRYLERTKILNKKTIVNFAKKMM